MPPSGAGSFYDPRKNKLMMSTPPAGFGGQTLNTRTMASPSSSFTNANNLYGAGVQQGAEDYDTIMGGYKGVLETPTTPITYNPYQYQPTPEYTGAINRLSGLAETGGYSEGDIGNLRARAISPIRAIYANAQRDINRGRALQGGYSPSYNASKVRMAREMSDLISGKTTDVNAALAERVAQNRIGTTGQLAGLTAEESARQNQYGQRNAETALEVAKYNQQQPLQQKMGALQGMQSLYGTTPALAALFGNQALNWAQLNQSRNANNVPQILSMYRGMRG